MKVAVAVFVLVAGYQVYQSEFSQYALGRKAGVRHVREMSAKGAFVRAGMNAANMIDLIPTNPDASPDWNAGFRAGFKEELERMYPEAKRCGLAHRPRSRVARNCSRWRGAVPPQPVAWSARWRGFCKCTARPRA